MSFYSKFSEQDLIESYKNQMDYQGKVSQELLDEIAKRGSFEDFQSTIEHQKKVLNERNRIIREIHHNYLNSYSKQECFSLLTSELVSREEIKELVDIKYTHIHQNIENSKVDSDTIMKSFVAIFISSAVSFILISAAIYILPFLVAFHFFLLIPIYIVNYWIIRIIVKKTRDNLAVFMATFLATVLDCFYFILFIS